MSEELILTHCSPTLAGLKTGSLFTCAYNSRGEMNEALRAMNRRLVPKGLRVIPLRYDGKKALIYLYRPRRLKKDLQGGDAARLLNDFGYPADNADHCLIELMRRLDASAQFPHEIGLFLGYPVEDVRGFIENRAAQPKLTGCWKVYGDEEKARRTFEKYRKCTSVYMGQWARGKSIERLTVAD